METRIDEIAPDIFRLSTLIEEVAPGGFSFNQFVVRADEPFLYHTGMRALFPLVSEAVAKILPVDSLRWISFDHVEADENGAMNVFLAVAPNAEIVHGELACMLTLNDQAARPPRPVEDGEVLDIGGKRMRFLATPHVPHNWESGVWYEETGNTLFAGDILTHTGGDRPAITTDDLVPAAMEAEQLFHATSGGPNLVPTLHRLADLEPQTLAIMHGSSFQGDGGAALRTAADCYEAFMLAGTAPA